MLFIVRDPLEATVRHNEGPRGIAEAQMMGYLDSWFALLQDYHDHPGPKVLVYYEELVKIADKASHDIYPNPQSTGPEFHRAKLGDELVARLERYMNYKYLFLVNSYL